MPTKKATSLNDLLQRLPQVDKLLQHPELTTFLERYPRPEVVRALRDTLEDLRTEIRAAERDGRQEPVKGANAVPSLDTKIQPRAIVEAAGHRLGERCRSYYRRVVNATGIILHTGLGRAVLAAEVVEAVGESLQGYTLVEVDPLSGERNRREAYLAELLCELTGAEAATVVNNNAAATLIILACLARGREVILSRGQLVEIGGSFRIPKIMEESGARLVEVGTTNRTYIDDYRQAITPETGLLLRVHTSNYEITGFAHHTPLAELVALGRQFDIPVVSDLGSGCFVDLSVYGLRREPLASESIVAGADLVCFSGDKLLGGPQAGIIVGKRELIESIRRHPLFRAVRIDKVTLVALEATLRLYRDPETLFERLPVLNQITRDEKSIRQRAQRFRSTLLRKSEKVSIELLRETSQTGSGSLPSQNLDTCAAAVTVEGLSAEELGARLRANSPAIFTRIRDDCVLIDFRTLLPQEEQPISEALLRIAGGDKLKNK